MSERKDETMGEPMQETRLLDLLKEQGLALEQLERRRLADGAMLYRVPVARREALAVWRRLREVVGCTGYWPLLSEAREGWMMLELTKDRSPAAVIEAAGEIDPPGWIAQSREEHTAWMMEHGYAPEEEEAAEGAWPDAAEPGQGFYLLENSWSMQRSPTLLLFLVPTAQPWAVPAYLPYGGWNECPDDAVQVAFLRRWHERYGAELVVMTSDTLEFAVARPPRTREEALALAREHYGYCVDIVLQGTETISNLAAALLDGTAWFFWWD